MAGAPAVPAHKNRIVILAAAYQRERRQLARRHKAAFATEPTDPNQVWLLEWSKFETTTDGTWRIAGCRDYWCKHEHPWHVSPTANQDDAIAAIEAALADYDIMLGHPLNDTCSRDADGNVIPTLTIVTDNGGPSRSFPIRSVHHRPPRVAARSHQGQDPGQNGSRELSSLISKFPETQNLPAA